jgi:APA family basic amino acid/polyamine antiporter
VIGPRRLGPGSATALVVAAMIGTGVFTASGYLLQQLGSPWAVLAVWGLGGVVAALGAVSYGALARRIPESGGEYVFLSRTIHPAAGYLAGWVTLVAGLAAPAAAGALSFGAYVRPWLPAFCRAPLVATVLLLAATALHAGTMARAARVQRIAVVVEVLLIVAFLVGGLGRLHVPATAAPLPSVGTFASALIFVSYSYSGWNTVVYVGGEVIDPTRNLPRAMLVGALGVTALYLALNVVFLFSAPAASLAGRVDVGRFAAQAIGGPWLGNAVSALIAFALATFVSSMTMAGPHVTAKMAADGYLPGILRARPGDPPRAALLLQLALSLVLVWLEQPDRLMMSVGFTLGLSTAVTVVGLIRLRRREGPALAVWGWPWVPALFLVFVLGSTGVAIVARPRTSALVAAALLAGFLIFRRQRARLA